MGKDLEDDTKKVLEMGAAVEAVAVVHVYWQESQSCKEQMGECIIYNTGYAISMNIMQTNVQKVVVKVTFHQEMEE